MGTYNIGVPGVGVDEVVVTVLDEAEVLSVSFELGIVRVS